MKKIIQIWCIVLAFFLVGCEEKIDSNIVSSGTKNTQEQLDAMQNVDKNSYKEVADVKKILQEQFSPYYINLSYSKTHTIDFLEKPQETAQFAQIYNIKPTPTLVFLTPKGKILFIYPGYMPKERFMATLEFLQNPSLESKEQKEISQELQAIFESKNI